jgi:uncharacterized membrane protein
VYYVEDDRPLDRDSWKKLVVRILAAFGMIAIGGFHFLRPDDFVKIVPAFFPMPRLLVFVSGFFEIAGGVGLLIPRFRRAAAIGLIALYIAVFPANVNMAVNGIQPVGYTIPAFALWLRLPFQLAFIALAWWLRRGTVRPARARARPPSRVKRGLRP